MRRDLLLFRILLLFRLLFCVLAFLLSVHHAAAQESVKVASQMRDIGYVLGDIAVQKVIVTTPRGYRLNSNSLPPVGKGGGNMELRKTDWVEQDEAKNTRHVITLEWQIFRVMQEVRSYPLRALELEFLRGNKKLSLHVDAAQVLVSSILPTAMDAAHLWPRAVIAPPPRQTRSWISGLMAGFGGLLLSGVYFVWRYDWLGFRLRSRQPFRRAYREIRALSRSGKPTLVELKTAMQILQRACDASAGSVVSAEQLTRLFVQKPDLLSLRAELEAFYAHSERVFCRR